MRSVLQLKIAFLLFTTFITVCLIGCGEISDMHIEDVDISVSETDKTVSDLTGARDMSLFSVTVWVIGIAGPNTCYGHHQTDYLRRDDYAGHPIYRNGDTIHISMSAFGGGFGICGDEESRHEEAIFVGFCVPGEYTLRVNDFTKTFLVGSDL